MANLGDLSLASTGRQHPRFENSVATLPTRHSTSKKLLENTRKPSLIEPRQENQKKEKVGKGKATSQQTESKIDAKISLASEIKEEQTYIE